MTAKETRSSVTLPRIPWWLGATLFAAIALFFLWEEHRMHILGALPWLLLLACPLIHILMHRGHRGHRGHGHGSGSSSGRERHDHSHRGGAR